MDQNYRQQDNKMLENSLFSPNEVSLSVRCAIKYGMTRPNTDLNHIEVRPSEQVLPTRISTTSESGSNCFYMICKSGHRPTDFPRRKHSEQCYEIKISETVSITVFYAVRDSKLEQRDKIDSIIEEYNKESKLRSLANHLPKIGQLVIGAYIDGENISYHRAVVLQNCTPGQDTIKWGSIIQFCDYGTIRRVAVGDLRFLPTKISENNSLQRLSVVEDTPSLAVKYRLRGVKAHYSEESQEDLVPQGAKFKYFPVDQSFFVRIYSTFDGDCVVADLFHRENPAKDLSIAAKDLAQDPAYLEDRTINAKLCNLEPNLVCPMKECHSHVLNMRGWIKDVLGADYDKYLSAPSGQSGGSGPETKDSGHDSKSISPSSFDATSTDDWIELEDSDSGNESLQSVGKEVRICGPNNIYRCSLSGKRKNYSYNLL